ncbi:hypothetical protein CYMTET_36482 [Cymbomonas tetramitiformis]|uniref:Cyclic nucleotide-binding domain-containing protein n=1 Tax=Cymbomonas tetramitiformis TaxID=36881 RepID=A0AAE0F6Y9_9CHLO|nr:hypothetical protein CYMTET_36482 [Cymbomonas tetramitiformis]
MLTRLTSNPSPGRDAWRQTCDAFSRPSKLETELSTPPPNTARTELWSSPSGPSSAAHMYLAGMGFGYKSLENGCDSAASVVAAKSCRVFKMDKAAFQRTLGHPKFGLVAIRSDFLQTEVKAFCSTTENQRSLPSPAVLRKLAMVLKYQRFKKGHVINLLTDENIYFVKVGDLRLMELQSWPSASVGARCNSIIVHPAVISGCTGFVITACCVTTCCVTGRQSPRLTD